MPFTCFRKPTLRHLIPSFAQGSTSPSFEAPISTPTLIALPNNNFFQEFMQIFMEKIEVSATLAVLAAKVRNNTDRFLKPQNFNLYYDYLYIEYYYFY